MAVFPGLLVLHVFANIHLAADDRVDAPLPGGLIKVHHPIHDPVVGDGAAVHAQALNLIQQRFNAAGAVQQAIFGMQMQMGKHGVSSER